MSEENKTRQITIPEGCFCGSCGTCEHSGRKDSDGRIYCDHYDRWFYPDERSGCLSYEAD